MARPQHKRIGPDHPMRSLIVSYDLSQVDGRSLKADLCFLLGYKQLNRWHTVTAVINGEPKE
jgi:hypothetical protein